MSGNHLNLAQVEALAREAHATQTDKAGRPYTEHLAAVAEGVRVRGGSDRQIAAAWLHDAIEDGALSARWLAEAALPQEVKDMVLAVTKRPGRSCPRTRPGSSPPRAPCSSRRRIWPTTRIRPAWPSWRSPPVPG